MTKPIVRIATDWDDDQFICVNARLTDALNRLHTGLHSDPSYVALHWNLIHQSAINSATVILVQAVTEYGIRQMHVVTGTNTTAGAYFGRTGSTNDFIVSNATVYTCEFFIKATVGSGTSMAISMENSTGSSTFTISSSWQKITRTFTTTGTTTAFKIVKNSSATNVTFDVTGFMIVAGSTAPNGFNVGHSTNLYDVLQDNVKRDVKSAQWSMGKMDWLSTVIREGTVSLTLNNESRIYSPDYSAGPLYGYMKQSLLFTIETQDPVLLTWTPCWRGFTSSYNPEPGKTTGNKEATIKCEQGKFQLDEIEYTSQQVGTMTADQVIRQLVLSGFNSAATPLQAVASRSNTDACYTVNEADIMTLDTGASELEITGESWGEGTTASKVIDELMKVERGFCFIDRSGLVKFYNRRHYLDPTLTPSTTSINLNTDAIDFGYSYGENYYNEVKVTYYPADESSVQILWKSQGPIYVKARKTKVVTAKLEYTEGKKKTAGTINPFDGSVEASTITVLNGASASGKVTAEVVSESNGRAEIAIKNGSMLTAAVSLVLNGTATESFGGQVVEVTDGSAGVRGGKRTYDVKSRLLTSEQQARNLANYLLNMLRRPAGAFKFYQLISKNDAALQRILNTGIGSKVSVSEYQTGHSGTYIVCGEEHDWTPGVLKSKFYLWPIDRINTYWVLGTSVLGTGTYLGY